jgi:hypothetical protein
MKNFDKEEDEFYDKLKKKKKSFEIKKLSKSKLNEIEKSMGGLKPTENDLKRIDRVKKSQEEKK